MAAPIFGENFAVAEYETKIQVWNVNNGFLRRFETDLDSGGKRLALSDKFLVVGSYNRNNVSLYSIDSGELIWSRDDQNECQVVRILKGSTEIVFVGLEERVAQLLSITDG